MSSTTDRVAAAQKALEDARALAAALDQRVLDGDDSVTAEDSAGLAHRIEFAEKRLDGAKLAVIRANADQRREMYELAAGAARAHTTIGVADLGRALAVTVEVVTTLWAAAMDYRDRGHADHQAQREVLGTAVEHGEVDVLAEAGIRDYSPGAWMTGAYRFTDADGTEHEVRLPPSPTDVVLAAVAVALESIPDARSYAGGEYMELINAASRTFVAIAPLEPADWRRTY